MRAARFVLFLLTSNQETAPTRSKQPHGARSYNARLREVVVVAKFGCGNCPLFYHWWWIWGAFHEHRQRNRPRMAVGRRAAGCRPGKGPRQIVLTHGAIVQRTGYGRDSIGV
jgi:hypothetical protein